jgi:anti-sigma regulatory factor (Ser/Thr protein kinase)
MSKERAAKISNMPDASESVSTARHAVALFCAGQALDHEAVAMAVSEAVANTVVHADRHGEQGRCASRPASMVAGSRSWSATTERT